MKANDLLDMIGNVDDGIIEEAKQEKKWSMTNWTGWIAAAACLCLALGGILLYANSRNKGENLIQAETTPSAGGHPVQMWNATYTAADYFKYSGTGDGQSSQKSIADSEIPYAESRAYSDDRSLMEENGMIPALDSHPLFDAQANFNEDGSICSVVFSWHRRDPEGLAHYSDLSVISGYEEVPAIEDCISVETDENGNILEPEATVTERDGVRILARGRENQGKTITFQNETGWYQISGSWNDSYADVAALYEWFWNHPMDFSWFRQEAGDLYTYTTLAEMPEAFSDSLPDFSAYGYVCGNSAVVLKNGQPVEFEAVYVSGVTERQAEEGTYTAGENGVAQIHWCLKAEPDFYDLEGCMGALGSVDKEQVLDLAPPDEVTTQTKIQLRQADCVLIIYTTDVTQAWELIASLR